MTKDTDKMLSISYWRGNNFGDALTAPLLEKTFGMHTQWAPAMKASFIGIGSILGFIIAVNGQPSKNQVNPDLSSPIHVWGTGLMYPHGERSTLIRPTVIHALRGRKTQRVISSIVASQLDCPVGDPGLLAPFLLEEVQEKKYRLGIVPHYADLNTPEFHELKARFGDSAALIDLTQPVNQVLKLVAQCETVVSSSLHGLITADAFGIPSRWVIASDKVLGDGFKYEDYYSAYNLYNIVPVDLRETSITPEEVEDTYPIVSSTVREIQKDLILSFPYASSAEKNHLLSSLNNGSLTPFAKENTETRRKA